MLSSCRNVAVIMCTYNGDDAGELKAAVDSIFQQDGVFDVRVYIHVDGQLEAALDSYIRAEERFYKVIASEVNVGLAKGLNKLIDQLEDEVYVFRMDADDLCDPARFARQIQFMETNQNVDACGGAIVEFEGDTNNIVRVRNYPLDQQGIIGKLHRGSPFAHPTMCFRRGFFSSFGQYPVEYPLNEDIAYWFECIKSGARFANLPATLVYLRMDGVYGRRSFKKAIPELILYLKISFWRRKFPLWPLLRFCFRLMPKEIICYCYRSRFRNRLLSGRG